MELSSSQDGEIQIPTNNYVATGVTSNGHGHHHHQCYQPLPVVGKPRTRTSASVSSGNNILRRRSPPTHPTTRSRPLLRDPNYDSLTDTTEQQQLCELYATMTVQPPFPIAVSPPLCRCKILTWQELCAYELIRFARQHVMVWLDYKDQTMSSTP